MYVVLQNRGKKHKMTFKTKERQDKKGFKK